MIVSLYRGMDMCLSGIAAAHLRQVSSGQRSMLRLGQAQQRQHCQDDHDQSDEVDDAMHNGLLLSGSDL